MPVVHVINWPSKVATIVWDGKKPYPDHTRFMHMLSDDNFFKTSFGKRLREAVVGACVHGIDSIDLVTVSFDGGASQQDDKTVVILVELLFDRPERTKEMRDRLAETLRCVAIGYCGNKIEVAVIPFNLEVCSCASTNS